MWLNLQNALPRLRDSDPSLTELCLFENKLGEERCKIIAVALEKNKTLKELDLRYKCIDAEGAKLLGEALRHNTSLKKLYLSGNALSDKGVTALAEGIRHNATLEWLYLDSGTPPSLSNTHACFLPSETDDSKLEAFHDNRCESRVFWSGVCIREGFILIESWEQITTVLGWQIFPIAPTVLKGSLTYLL
mmetsp:Transcript_40421/g.96056  ORF Transcript_40421/g.96056 Transcript_40421/m.96056 type:complete len:190 (-) Transcript_40421:3481-4050(-)